MNRRSSQALVASPVLVGAVTLLVVIVGVFLAYNANSGLPFVPTYTLRAELPTGAKLVKGNEVRIGGFRVGAVSKIDGAVRRVDGRRRAIAVVELQLDKSIQPLSVDTRMRVRPRSALGVKYIEVTPGRSERDLATGARVPLAQGSQSNDFEDAFATFDRRTRPNLRKATEGFGTAFSGRGQSINQALAALPPLLDHLEPVMATLSDPSTDLSGFVRNLGAVTAQVAPVAPQAAALARERGRHVRGAEPLAGGAGRRHRRHAAHAGRGHAGAAAHAAGGRADDGAAAQAAPRHPRAAHDPAAGQRRPARGHPGAGPLGGAVRAPARLLGGAARPDPRSRTPGCRCAICARRWRSCGPTLQFVAPYQTVCNFASYFFHALGEHQSQPAPGGNAQQQLLRFVNQTQPNSLGFTYSSRPWDLQPGQPAQGAMFDAQPAGRPFAPPYQPAIDAQGNADCQNGQVGFPNFRMIEDFVRKNGAGGTGDPGDIVTGTLPDGTPAGANSVVGKSNYPGLSGGTYKSRELGIDNLRDVP